MNTSLVTTTGLLLAMLATAATAQERGGHPSDRDTAGLRVEESAKESFSDRSHGAPRDGSHDGSDRYGRSDRGSHDADRGSNGDDGNRHGDQRYDGRHDSNRYDRHGRDGIGDGYRGDRHTGRGYDHRGGHRYGDPGYRHYGRYRAPHRYAYPRGYDARSWSIGHRLPPAYYGPSYYVDYRPYGLAPPPFGYRWVRIDNDVVLVAIATGLIADIVDDLYY